MFFDGQAHKIWGHVTNKSEPCTIRDYNIKNRTKNKVRENQAPASFFSWRVNFMFIAANSAARYLNTYGIETVSIPLLVLQETHVTFLGSLPGGMPAISRTIRFLGCATDVVRILPHIEQTSAM